MKKTLKEQLKDSKKQEQPKQQEHLSRREIEELMEYAGPDMKKEGRSLIGKRSYTSPVWNASSGDESQSFVYITLPRGNA